jgi:hypothetical protein
MNRDEINLDWIADLMLEPEPDIFFETMMGMIKNDLVSYQIFARKGKNKFFSDLKNDTLMEAELRGELKKFASFDFFNDEKITPHFLRMAKTGKSDADLGSVKKEDGTNFSNDTERDSFIVNYYRQLYKKKDDEVPLEPDCIETFLGPDICRSSTVRNSKLTDREKLNLDCDFTVAELDRVMEDINVGTASGPDGVGNGCVKKIWRFIRRPLVNYANHCLTTGRLTENFRTASIKLIPKKGDISKIKNWRPISLLNCSYKIILKAINERLKKIANRVLSRG